MPMRRRWKGAFRTFTLLRVGDVAFLSGIVLAYQLYGTLEFQPLFAKAAESPVTLTPLPGIEISGTTAVTLLLFIGAMSKSAQFPFHIWLPRYLYAPTPVHGAATRRDHQCRWLLDQPPGPALWSELDHAACGASWSVRSRRSSAPP